MSGAKIAAIGDFCVTGSGGTPSRSNSAFYGGEIPWVKSGELREEIITDSEEKITSLAIGNSSAKIVPAGTILIAMYGANVGRVATLGIDAATNQAVCNIQPDPRLADTRYIFHYLQSRIDHFLSRAAGGAQPNISQRIIRETPVPLPPLEEQRQIAAILDKSDALRRKRKRTLELLGGLTQSIFLEMFGHPENNFRGLEQVTVGDLLSDTQYGTNSKAGPEGRFPIIRMGNISYTGYMDYNDLKYIDFDGIYDDKYTVRRGDILFNRTNSASLVGKTGLYEETRPMAFAGYLIRLRTNERCIPEYLHAHMNSHYSKSILKNMAKSIIGMANINAKELKTIPILAPSINDQKEFMAQIRVVNEHQITAGRALKATSRLFESLQARAFAGGV